MSTSFIRLIGSKTTFELRPFCSVVLNRKPNNKAIMLLTFITKVDEALSLADFYIITLPRVSRQPLDVLDFVHGDGTV